MQVQTVTIGKLDKPSVAVGHIRRILAVLLRILHIEALPKPVDPCSVLPEGFRLCHNISNIIILKNIVFRLRINPGSIHIYGADSAVRFSRIENH